MNLERYPTAVEEDGNLFIFESVGVKGTITKVIQFVPIGFEGFYHLGFGDYDPISREVNDRAISNNGDTEKVLATVVYSVYLFTTKFPAAKVIAYGSTSSRNRLYQIGISKYLDAAKSIFHVFGDRGEERWEAFERGVNYERVMVVRKQY